MVTVISLGGSIVAPDKPDAAFIRKFAELIRRFIEKDEDRRFIFVVGGGGPARAWQGAYREIEAGGTDAEADWIGVMATRLNAQLVRAVFSDICREDVVTNPTEAGPMMGKALVASGWKPGFSSDYDAVLLAERFKADTVVNLSNIEKVYTDDPKKNPDAKPIDRISWDDFRAMVGDEWVPGKNVPFDPVASRHAAKIALRVICASGRNLDNLRKILHNEPFLGTLIS
jgi:uridylate kinase